MAPQLSAGASHAKENASHSASLSAEQLGSSHLSQAWFGHGSPVESVLLSHWGTPLTDILGWLDVYVCMCCTEARSVVVTQPNNKLSRVLKGLLKELPGQMRAINAAGLVASLAMNDVVAAVAGPAAAEAARDQLQQQLQMIRALQVRFQQLADASRVRS